MNAVKLGVGSALTASACCLGPAVLAAAGLGGLGVGIFFARFSGLLVAVAAVLLAFGWRRYITEVKHCKAAHCRMAGGKVTLATLSIASLIVAAFTWMHLGPALSQAACAISCPRPP